jgi:hypothetical protein
VSFELARMSLTRRSRPRRSDLFFALLLAFALGGSPGCVTRMPLPVRLGDYFGDFTPGAGMGGCPDVAGTYVATGHADDYLITFPFVLVLPVWWGQYPEQPRLDMDLGLVLDGKDAVKVEGAEHVILAQPDANHLVITLIDDSGRAIENFEEIVFTRFGRGIARPENWTRGFSCSTSHALMFGWGRPYEAVGSEIQIVLGRLPDGRLAVRTHAYMFSSKFFFDDQQWHLYESVSSPEPSP